MSRQQQKLRRHELDRVSPARLAGLGSRDPSYRHGRKNWVIWLNAPLGETQAPEILLFCTVLQLILFHCISPYFIPLS